MAPPRSLNAGASSSVVSGLRAIRLRVRSSWANPAARDQKPGSVGQSTRPLGSFPLPGCGLTPSSSSVRSLASSFSRLSHRIDGVLRAASRAVQSRSCDSRRSIASRNWRRRSPTLFCSSAVARVRLPNHSEFLLSALPSAFSGLSFSNSESPRKLSSRLLHHIRDGVGKGLGGTRLVGRKANVPLGQGGQLGRRLLPGFARVPELRAPPQCLLVNGSHSLGLLPPSILRATSLDPREQLVLDLATGLVAAADDRLDPAQAAPVEGQGQLGIGPGPHDLPQGLSAQALLDEVTFPPELIDEAVSPRE